MLRLRKFCTSLESIIEWTTFHLNFLGGRIYFGDCDLGRFSTATDGSGFLVYRPTALYTFLTELPDGLDTSVGEDVDS